MPSGSPCLFGPYIVEIRCSRTGMLWCAVVPALWCAVVPALWLHYISAERMEDDVPRVSAQHN